MQDFKILRLLLCLLFSFLQCISSQEIEEKTFCVLRDYITLSKIFIKQTQEVNLPYWMYTANWNKGNSTSIMYFTLCGNLPRDIRDLCGIETSDNSVYTFIEFDGDRCIPRKDTDIVTVRYYNRNKFDTLDIVYHDPTIDGVVIIGFKLLKSFNFTTTQPPSVSYSAATRQLLFHSKPVHVFQTVAPYEFVTAKGLYFLESNMVIGQLFKGFVFFLMFIFCTFFYNYLSQVKFIYPFNFYINFYVSYRLIDFVIMLVCYPYVSRWITTPTLLITPLFIGYFLQALGPGFTYRRTMYIFYCITLADTIFLYAFTSYVILALGMIHLLLLSLVGKWRIAKERLRDSEEWIASIFISLNFFSSVSVVFRSIKHWGAIRLMLFSVSEYYSNIIIMVWILLSFILIPVVAYLRYTFSDKLIIEYYERINMRESVVDTNPSDGKGLAVVEEES